MKKGLVLIGLVISCLSFAQATSENQNAENTYRIGINTESPQTTLDIREIAVNELPVGTPQGVIFPSFTTGERATFQNVKEGTMIFNTTLKCLELYNGTVWRCLK